MALAFDYLTSTAAIDNTNLISEAQWAALARMSLRSNLTITQLFSGFHVEAIDRDNSDAVRLVGYIHCSPTYKLYGCIDVDGSTHT